MINASAIRAVHLRPTAELAERVLLPGDPHRALAVAQALMDGPKMFNHTRGLWGYSGPAADGRPLTIQSTGLGGPSAAIVCEELIALGARRLVRIGTCTALDGAVEPGSLLAARTVLSLDGAGTGLAGASPSSYTPASATPSSEPARLEPDPALLGRLVEAGATPATVASTDLFYDPRAQGPAEAASRGALALELESAAILAVAARHGAAAACVLGVAGVDGGGRLGIEELEELGLRLGEAGYAALRIP